MQRSKLPYFFLGLAALLAASALIMLLLRLGGKPAPGPLAIPPSAEKPAIPKIQNIDEPLAPQNPETLLNELGSGVKTTDPAELVNHIAKALESGDLATLVRLIGKDALNPQSAEHLAALSAAHLHLRQPGGIREVGELELSAHTRWALEFDGLEIDRNRILLDLKRDAGKWRIDKIVLPPAPGQAIPKHLIADSLGVADAFLQAVLKQDFELARRCVDQQSVSDAKIAGLCILFEEGEYRMRKSKPLRAMFQRPDTAGYLAHVETADGTQSAQFSITTTQQIAAANWLISEINLDQLIADYTRRLAGGDVYYSPLVRNPSGGDTLALYFEFNEDAMNPRTRRQLEIVSSILKSDPGKKLTLSGHTDSLGTENYNKSLSKRRADVVRDYLIEAGVNTAQIITLAKGSSQPRRPNVTETGEDAPEGRRANRRTEIYLDF